ncbi:MAG: alpha/beta fold hydrolase [Chloroflexota bacterium]
MTTTYTAPDGTRYAVTRSGQGTPVLLLHGFTGRADDWMPFRPALERLTAPIAVDLLGHGASDAPHDPARHAVERQAADLAAFLRAQGAAPAHVAGYSFGARVALRLAVDHPDVVASLLLESPSAGIADPDARAARRAADDDLARDLERDGIAAFVERWEALPLFAGERALPAADRAATHAARLRNDPYGLAASLRGAGQGAMAPLHEALATITVPTTVIAGALDQAGLPRAQSVARAIPSARLVVVPETGHAVHREQPARLARELAAHLVRSSSFCTTEQCVVPDAAPALTAARSRP